MGIVRGRDINATGILALDHDAMVLEWPQAAAWRLALDGIEGLGIGAQGLTVYLRDHDVLELIRDFVNHGSKDREIRVELKNFKSAYRMEGFTHVHS
ncbi:MAG: hypothetical protein ACK5U0_13675, partial [Gemmatimonas sp.]|uniref:hypothetical protein n=1 Tax=Gemmatimonas sp. TaxID=1962908 RepID=UPI00391C6B23